ncbi:MAG: class I SAM-dependent methyltransferase [Rhodobacteraceae bacterium]|nr:class I SAM-dependent methyltransferase [Paracoccaceae bacterium]
MMMHCSLCGTRGEPTHQGGTVRDGCRCPNCRAQTYQRDLSQIIVDEFGRGRSLDLRSLCNSGRIDDLDVYEVGMVGPVAPYFLGLPGYVRSYLWEDVPLGEEKDGVQCQDLRALTFADESFDLVISIEVFEHVFEVEKAFKEVARVLKPGGCHVFSIPVYYPFPEHSTVRAELRDGEIHYLEEARYHVAGDGSESLVVTDWGEDIFDAHDEAGLKLTCIRRGAPSVPEFQNASFIARKPG